MVKFGKIFFYRGYKKESLEKRLTRIRVVFVD
jgi:hypothetical protein